MVACLALAVAFAPFFVVLVLPCVVVAKCHRARTAGDNVIKIVDSESRQSGGSGAAAAAAAAAAGEGFPMEAKKLLDENKDEEDAAEEVAPQADSKGEGVILEEPKKLSVNAFSAMANNIADLNGAEEGSECTRV